MRLPSRFTEGAAVSVTYEGFTVSFLPENALASLGTAAQPNSMTHDASLRTASMTRAEVQAENDRRTALPEQRSSMTYANLWSGVTARYTLQGQTLKEELVFRSAPTQTAFSFILRSGGLTPVLQENGEIWLYKSGSDTPLLSIQSPYMVDAAGV